MTTSPRRPAALITAVSLTATMFGLEISSVPVALPLIRTHLGSGLTALQWVVTAYTVASVTVLIAAGVIADRIGRRRVLLIAVTGFGAASLACGLAPATGWLVAARFAQGMSGGAMMICGLAILSHRFTDGPGRARAFGAWGVGLGFGLGLGPVIGLGLIAAWGWRGVFLVHVPLAVLALALGRRVIAESRDPAPGRLDLGGIATLATGLVALVFTISQGPQLGFTSTACLLAAGLAVLAFATFAIVETRAAAPMLPPSMLRSRRFTGALLGAVGMNVSFWPLIVYVPLYLQDGLGYRTAVASVVLLGFTLPTFVLPPLAERLALRFGAERMIPLGLAVIGTGLLALVLGVTVADAGWLPVLPGAVVAGIGLGLTNTPVTNTTTGSVPDTQAGAASGVDLAARFTFLSLTIAVMGALYDGGSPTTGFTRATLFGAIAVLALALGSRALFGRAARGSGTGLADDGPGAPSSHELLDQHR